MEVKREARVGLVLAFLISLVTGTPISSDLQNEKPSSTSIPIPTENTPNDDSIIVPHPTLIDPLDPLDVKNVQYEENFIHPMNEELKTIIDTIDNIESNMGSQNSASDGKNLGHLIDLLEEIKRRIDLFKKDVAEILGPLALNGGFHRPHHHRHHFSGEFTQTSSTEIESTRPEKPETEDKPKPEVPLKIDSPTEEKPVVPTKDKVPAKPTKTDVNKTDETDIKKEEVETSGPIKNEKPTKTETSDPIKAGTPTKADKKEPTKTETPTKTDKEEPTKTETPTETDKPAKEPIKEETPAEPAPAKTDFSSKFINPRAKRSPYRGFGGPYYGGGNFGGLGYGNGYGGGLYGGPYGGNRYSYGGYGGGYPYINNGGWRPVLYG